MNQVAHHVIRGRGELVRTRLRSGVRGSWHRAGGVAGGVGLAGNPPLRTLGRGLIPALRPRRGPLSERSRLSINQQFCP